MEPSLSSNHTSPYTGPERRRNQSTLFTLTELDPRDVIDGEELNGHYLTPDSEPVGYMREHCPHCHSVSLQLLLRYGHVKRSHLFCKRCTRCYDALDANGYSALSAAALSLS